MTVKMYATLCQRCMAFKLFINFKTSASYIQIYISEAKYLLSFYFYTVKTPLKGYSQNSVYATLTTMFSPN